MYLRSSNSLHSILSSVLCKKMKQYWLKFHASGQHCGYIDSSGTRWYGSAPIPRGMVPIPCGIVQPITEAVLKTFAMTNKNGTLHPHAGSHFCTLKEYEIITLIYNRKSCRLDLLFFWAPGAIRPCRQHKVWRKILLNTNSWYLTEAFESMHTLFLLTKSAAACLFQWY